MKQINKKFYELLPKVKYDFSEIKYVAIGDSFAAGLNSKFGFCSNGNLKNNTISGLSYPSFFANYLFNTNLVKLNSYDNLSIPLSNIDFWTFLIQNNKHKLSKYQNIIDFAQTLDWNVSNHFNNFLSSYFNKRDISKNDFKIISQKISMANFISITISLNDLIEEFPYAKINELKDKNNQYEDVLKSIINDLNVVFNKIKDKYIKLIKLIKSLSPKSYVVIIPYTKPFMKIYNSFSEIFYLYNEKINFSLYDYVFDWFNQLERDVAYESKVNYVNTYDSDYWAQNSNFLNENIYSAHPTEKGYKKIAMDLFAKLFIKKDEMINKNIPRTIFNKYIFDDNENYWRNDLNSYANIFKIDKPNDYIFKLIYGDNINFNLLKSNNLEKKYNHLLSSYLKISPYIENYIRYYKKDIFSLFRKWIEIKFNDNLTKYNSISKLLTILEDEQKIKDLLLLFLKNGKLEKILFKLQHNLKNNLNDNKLDNISLFFLKSNLAAMLKDNQKISYDLIKQLFDSKIIEKYSHDFKEFTNLFVKDCLKTDILEFIYGYKLNDNYKKIRNYLSSLNSFIEITNYLVDSITNHSTLYSPLKSYDEFWANWIINNKYKIIYLMDKLFFEISNDNLINKTVNFIYEVVTLNIKQDSMVGKDQRSIKTAIKSILIELKDNPKNLNSLFINFVNKIKTYSIFDIITKKTNGNIFKLKNWIGANNLLFLVIKLSRKMFTIKKIIKKYKN